MCPGQPAPLPVHCVFFFVSPSLEPWEWYFPDYFAFSVLAVVYVLPTRAIWLGLENRREAAGFPLSSGSIGRSMCGPPGQELLQWLWCHFMCLGVVEVHLQRVPDCLEAALSLCLFSVKTRSSAMPR